jgi:hypothetical protein
VKRAAMAAALFAAFSAHAASNDQYQVRNAADLVAVCDTQPSAPDYATAVAFCHGWGAGAAAYHRAITAKGAEFVCTPEPAPKRSKVAADFVAWVKASPERGKEAAVDALFRYLGETYPCKK